MRCISALRVRTPNALHGELTPPALGRTCRRRCRWAILADESDTFPTGAYAPRSWRWYNDHPPEERRFLRCTNAHSQERRASARRGLVKPTLRGENRALLCDHATDVQERRASARGGSQTHPQSQTFFPNGNTCVPRLVHASRSWLGVR
jgi:hypothetical protein